MKRGESAALTLVLLAVGVLLGSLVLGLRDAPAEPAGAGSGAKVLESDRERIRVEVLNAAGTPGLAREGTRVLRARGFDVVYFGNATSFGEDSTRVILRSGTPAGARLVAEALGAGRVREEPDSTLYLEVTVVLGTDWVPPEAPLSPLSADAR